MRKHLPGTRVTLSLRPGKFFLKNKNALAVNS